MKILITGAAGSLGREFVNYLHKNNQIIALDNNEWAIAELRQKYPDIKSILQDFDHWEYSKNPCDVLIHCAAYKHVNLGEENPVEFLENNVIHLNKLFKECYKHDVKILFISTDKAVEPISLYGYTKAIGEKLAWYYQGRVARLGNIINSSGSVIPAWEEAIRNNEPIQITDLAMKRYFITAERAVKELWDGFKSEKTLIIPNMKLPLTLLEILTEVLKIHGYNSVDDYKPGIEIIGIRPGEKLEEKLAWDWEKQQC